MNEDELKKNQRKQLVGFTMMIIAIILVIIFAWNGVRWLHYKLGYESKVRQQVIEMVKPDALKDKYRNSPK